MHREETTHQRTCQEDSNSLLVAITKILESTNGVMRFRAEDWDKDHVEL